jgi:hypothetical protein
MNEHDWLTGTDPIRLLEARYPIRGHDSTEPQSRQSRLYLLACARAHWANLPPVGRAVVWLGELYADNPAGHEWVRAGAEATLEHLIESPDAAEAATAALLLNGHIEAEQAEAWAAATADPVGPPLPGHQWRGVMMLARLAFESRTPAYHWVRPTLYRLDLLHEVFGNPFRRTVFRPEWRTSTTLALAHSMYESREFGAMPILADALQDAGCDDAALLGHCRDDAQAHARGCWVLDAIRRPSGTRS